MAGSAVSWTLHIPILHLPSWESQSIHRLASLAPIVQRIEQRFPEPQIQVRFLVGAPLIEQRIARVAADWRKYRPKSCLGLPCGSVGCR